MMHQVINAFLFAGTGITALSGGTLPATALADNASVTPTNPAHAIGDTLLCVAMSRGGNGSVTLSCATSGWVDATGAAGMNAFGASATNTIRFFINECDSNSETNPTITISGGATGNTVLATVIRIQGRRFGQSFTMGTVSDNATTTNSLLLAQNSPSIGVGDAVLAIGLKNNDGGVGSYNAITGITAGLTWIFLAGDWNSTIGFDESGAILGAINNTGAAYTAGTGGNITGRTLSVGAPSSAVYLKIAA